MSDRSVTISAEAAAEAEAERDRKLYKAGVGGRISKEDYAKEMHKHFSDGPRSRTAAEVYANHVFEANTNCKLPSVPPQMSKQATTDKQVVIIKPDKTNGATRSGEAMIEARVELGPQRFNGPVLCNGGVLRIPSNPSGQAEITLTHDICCIATAENDSYVTCSFPTPFGVCSKPHCVSELWRVQKHAKALVLAKKAAAKDEWTAKVNAKFDEISNAKRDQADK